MYETQPCDRSSQIRGALTIIALIVFFSGNFIPAYAEETRTPFLASRQARLGKVLVFDNDLLDRLFGKDRESQRDNGKNHQKRDSIPASRPHSLQGQLIKPKQSFALAITTRSSPSQVAALRLAEKGVKLLQAREYQRAIVHLEKALALHANPYFHFYLARSHYYLGHYLRSLEFLEVAESQLVEQPSWMAEVALLRQSVSVKRAVEHNPAPTAAEVAVWH